MGFMPILDTQVVGQLAMGWLINLIALIDPLSQISNELGVGNSATIARLKPALAMMSIARSPQVRNFVLGRRITLPGHRVDDAENSRFVGAFEYIPK